MTYAEQLKHPNWQKKRLEVMSGADFKCQKCKSGDNTLNVHHKKYIRGRKAWQYRIEDFECLCEGCHKFTHELGKVEPAPKDDRNADEIAEDFFQRMRKMLDPLDGELS